MSSISNSIERTLAKTPLKTRIKVMLEMDDYENWENGTYQGDQEENANMIVGVVREWQKDGADLE
jgi:alcohol dehydrogenase YqhD (iron-dependent ADH family)